MSKISIKKYLLISPSVIFHLLVGMHIVSAADTFQNNLLKVDLYESSLGGVKVTLYTNKPYNDAVSVNKKSDSEYVILMPETSNSLTAKPSLKSASTSVKNVEVKTQQYSGQIKGYTKIVVTTSKPVEIVPQVQVLSGAPQMTDKEYNELMAQSAKKKVVSAPKAVTSAPKVAAKAVAKPPVFVQKPRAAVQTITSETKATATKSVAKKPLSQQKAVLQKAVAPKISSSKIVKETAKVAVPVVAQKNKTSNVVTPVAKVQTSTAQAPVTSTPKNEISKVETSKGEVPKSQDVVTPVVSSESKTETTKSADVVTPVETTAVLPAVAPVVTPQKVGKLQYYKHMIKNQIQATLKKNNMYTLAGMALIPIILLLLILRVLSKNIKKMKSQKSNFMANLKEKPVKTTDIEGKINDSMNWKEKFKTYTEATREREQAHTHTDNAQASQELDDLFGDDEFPRIDEAETKNAQEPLMQEEGFYDETSDEPSQEPSQEPSIYDDIYKAVDADYENPAVVDEITEESQPQMYNESVGQEPETSELDKFNQGMGQAQYISDEDVSLDELFGADEEGTAPTTSTAPGQSYGYEVNPLMEEPTSTQKDFQVEFSDDFSFDTAVVDEEFEKELLLGDILEDGLLENGLSSGSEEMVKSEFVIDYNKGFYLVDYEDTTALVGHIADEIFVLKKFDTKVEGNLQARMDERKENSINYMTRVGKFKALVQVTPENMNLLIEL